MFISQGTKELVKDMVENPENWNQSLYYFEHKSHRDVMIWTSNGLFHIRLGAYGHGATFNIFEKLYVMAGIKLSQARKISDNKKESE